MPRVRDETPGGKGKNTGRLPKIVYVARDGRDCAVSFWRHLKSQSVEDGGWQGGWDAFFDAWIEGSIAFGSWFDHLLSWRDAPAARFGAPEAFSLKKEEEKKYVRDHPVLAVRYEDMKTDLRGVARAVAAHVDPSRPLCEHELDEIVRACTFEAMKEDIEKYQPISVRWTDETFSFEEQAKAKLGTETFGKHCQSRECS
jgi:hypothetical protein